MIDPDQSERSVRLKVGSDRRALSIRPGRQGWSSEILPGERWDDQAFLSDLVGQPKMMERLRKLLEVRGISAGNDRSDKEIVADVARLIRGRELCLERNPFEPLPWPAPKAVALAPSREPPPQQRAASQASTSTPSSAPPRQEQLIDQDGFADTLERMAQNGAPFCEDQAQPQTA